LRIGEAVSRLSRIDDISFKSGRSGALVFVRVVHETSGERGLAITEAQDIVYRDHPRAGDPVPAASAALLDAGWTREVTPDPVLLFRYSALTFNGHRIHYDRPYATGVEGYDGLVVHGPLTATLLLDHLSRQYPAARVTHFQFRGVKPILDTAPFTLCGRIGEDGTSIALWAQNRQGELCMEAKAVAAERLI
jgi:3-methylfumaryl-CoA hydratase